MGWNVVVVDTAVSVAEGALLHASDLVKVVENREGRQAPVLKCHPVNLHPVEAELHQCDRRKLNQSHPPAARAVDLNHNQKVLYSSAVYGHLMGQMETLVLKLVLR